ncbi:hypothetical protein PLICRDRAFT_45079 [Plicaturopsis crispa FD-325 SS-3]|nr:hypothetical protein PLICRDRAFT_45079 [Plicaturopsis crispa FD-325 SS-3]
MVQEPMESRSPQEHGQSLRKSIPFACIDPPCSGAGTSDRWFRPECFCGTQRLAVVIELPHQPGYSPSTIESLMKTDELGDPRRLRYQTSGMTREVSLDEQRESSGSGHAALSSWSSTVRGTVPIPESVFVVLSDDVFAWRLSIHGRRSFMEVQGEQNPEASINQMRSFAGASSELLVVEGAVQSEESGCSRQLQRLN